MKRMNMTKTVLALMAGITFTAMTVLPSCKKSSSSTPAPTMTLYDSLGGTTMVQDPSAATGTMIEKGRLGIRSVVDSAIFVIAADTSLNKYFTVLLSEVGSGNLSGFQALSKNLTDFFCVATGAKDFTYSGKSMTDAHNPATNSRMNGKADAADFTQFINDVGVAAGKNSIPSYLTARLVTVMNSVQSQVVQR